MRSMIFSFPCFFFVVKIGTIYITRRHVHLKSTRTAIFDLLYFINQNGLEEEEEEEEEGRDDR